jgi:hypothetical protein
MTSNNVIFFSSLVDSECQLKTVLAFKTAEIAIIKLKKRRISYIQLILLWHELTCDRTSTNDVFFSAMKENLVLWYSVAQETLNDVHC